MGYCAANFGYYTNYESSPATGLSTTSADERTKTPSSSPSTSLTRSDKLNNHKNSDE